jgi:hypothetical protein
MTRWSWSCWMIMSYTVVFPDVVPPETPWKKLSSNSQSKPPEWEATSQKGEHHGREWSGSTTHWSLLLLKALGSKSVDLPVERSPVMLGADVWVLYPLWSRKMDAMRVNVAGCCFWRRKVSSQVYRRQWDTSSVVTEMTWCSYRFFPVVALEDVKECDWEAAGNSLVTGRGGEGKHTGRCYVAAMSIRE